MENCIDISHKKKYIETPVVNLDEEYSNPKSEGALW